MTELTIELPDTLAKQLDSYLQAHPDESLVGLIREGLERKRTLKGSSKLLALAGIVSDAPKGAAEHAEDGDD